MRNPVWKLCHNRTWQVMGVCAQCSKRITSFVPSAIAMQHSPRSRPYTKDADFTREVVVDLAQESRD